MTTALYKATEIYDAAKHYRAIRVSDGYVYTWPPSIFACDRVDESVRGDVTPFGMSDEDYRNGAALARTYRTAPKEVRKGRARYNASLLWNRLANMCEDKDATFEFWWSHVSRAEKRIILTPLVGASLSFAARRMMNYSLFMHRYVT